MASQETVRILDGSSEIARHSRSWDKGQQIEDEAHLAALTEAKRAATKERGQNRLRVAVPSSALLLKEAGERGHSLRSVVRALQRLLDEYGASEMELACIEALERGVPHDNAVRQSLERRREQRQLPPALALALPDNEQARNLTVRTHTLAAYDQINQPASLTTPLNRKHQHMIQPPITTAPDPAERTRLHQRAQVLKLPGLLEHWDELSDEQLK